MMAAESSVGTVFGGWVGDYRSVSNGMPAEPLGTTLEFLPDSDSVHWLTGCFSSEAVIRGFFDRDQIRKVMDGLD